MEEAIEKPPTEDEAPGKSGSMRLKKLLLIGAAGVILLLVLGSGLWWLLRGTAPKKAPLPAPAALPAPPPAMPVPAAVSPTAMQQVPTAEEQAALARKAEQQGRELIEAHRHILESDSRGTVEGLSARLAKPAAPTLSKSDTNEKAAGEAVEKMQEREDRRSEKTGRDSEMAAQEGADKVPKAMPLPTGRGFEVTKDNVEGLKDLIEQMNRADTRPPKKGRQ